MVVTGTAYGVATLPGMSPNTSIENVSFSFYILNNINDHRYCPIIYNGQIYQKVMLPVNGENRDSLTPTPRLSIVHIPLKAKAFK